MSAEVNAPKYPILDDIEVPGRVMENWQVTVDMLAEIAGIPAALIMRVHAREIEVSLSSHSPGNAYHPGERAPLDTGLYCETVMSTRRRLLVPNALKDPDWDHNPDVKLGMISYCGLPLTWPNGEIFGTICLLDKKENACIQRTHDLMERFRNSILFDLASIYESSLIRSQRDEAQSALRDAQAQLVRREKLAVLGQISGGIAHELRQPLAIISNAVYFLQTVQVDAAPTAKEYLGLIAAELHTADRIIADLLNFAHAQATAKEPAALAALVEQALARNPPPPGIAVQISLPPGLPPVYVDPRQLGQVLNNLIINAYQAMPRGGRLTLTATPCAAGLISLAVSDTGDGIAPENLSRLFEPLFTTKPKGIGLGLTVTQMLVEANGGAIEVMSETGRGATFQLTLPAEGTLV